MKNKFAKILSISLLSLGVFSGAVLSATKGLTSNDAIVSAYTNGDGATYYNDIGEKTGTQLLSALQSLNNTKLKSRVGYGSMPSKYTTTDPGTSSGQVTSFYSGKSAVYSGNMNREHVWPASRTVGGRNNDPLEDDIHMTRPTLTSENSARGNSFFTVSGGGGWDPASFNNESYRGDSARIIFYCAVADSRLKIVDKSTDSSSNHTMGKLSDLLRWNLQYSVASREMTRNEEAEKLQGNRNPFIDHPEYACKIWGNTNATTQSICSAYVKTVSIDKTELNMHEDEYEQITATSSDSTAITWSKTGTAISLGSTSSSSGAAITVKSVGVGTGTITATSASGATATINYTVLASANYISLTSTGHKTRFIQGQEFVYNGVCKANYDDGTSKEVTPEITKDGNTDQVGTFTVKLSYTEKAITHTFEYEVNVEKAPSPLASISVSGQKTHYELNEKFEREDIGTVIATYEDGTTKDVTDVVTILPPLVLTNKAGEKKIALEHRENDVTKSTSYMITIGEPAPSPDNPNNPGGSSFQLQTWMIVAIIAAAVVIVAVAVIVPIVVHNKKKKA